jgi:hypothetical protein
MALFALLFMLGILSGVGITRGVDKLAEKSFGEEDRLEKSLKELEIGFKHLDQKYIDLHMEVEQMRNILKINGFEKDVDIPSTLRTLSEKIEIVKSNQDFDRKTQAKFVSSLIDDITRVKKYVTRIASGNEY